MANEHVKRCTTLLVMVIKMMQITTTVKQDFTSTMPGITKKRDSNK